MPLSFLSILGGTCSLIGTSTNLVVQGLLIKTHLKPMTFFEVGSVGLPCAVLGAFYMLTVGRKLLPDRKEMIEQLEETRREYLVEMMVQPGCRLAGKTVAQAGLRQLPGLFLIEIDREGVVLGPVSPEEVIRVDDRLVFTGVVNTIVDLEKIPGLVPAADSQYELSPVKQWGRRLCEAVISPSSPLVNVAVEDADFRALYDAAIVAVHRNGTRVSNKVGDIRLHAGDTLLLQTGTQFTKAFRNKPDFYLVSDVEDSRPVRFNRSWLAALIFIGMITAFVSGRVDIMIAGFLAAGAMVATGCISAGDARKIGRLAGLDRDRRVVRSGQGARAVRSRQAIRRHAGRRHSIAGPDGNARDNVLRHDGLERTDQQQRGRRTFLPVLPRIGRLLGVSERPFIMAVTLAASYAFASPMGYQTHMMVFGPGGYRFTDFMRVGIPLNLFMWIVAVILIPMIWPFALPVP